MPLQNIKAQIFATLQLSFYAVIFYQITMPKTNALTKSQKLIPIIYLFLEIAVVARKSQRSFSG